MFISLVRTLLLRALAVCLLFSGSSFGAYVTGQFLTGSNSDNNYSSVVVGPSNTFYGCWRGSVDPSTNSSFVKFATYNGSSWTEITTASFTGQNVLAQLPGLDNIVDLSRQAMAVDSSGNIHLALSMGNFNGSAPGIRGLCYGKYTAATKTWAFKVLFLLQAGNGGKNIGNNGYCLKLDASGNPHVVFQWSDASSGVSTNFYIKYAFFNGSVWNVSGTQNANDGVLIDQNSFANAALNAPDITFDSAGNLYCAYTKQRANFTPDIWYAVKPSGSSTFGAPVVAASVGDAGGPSIVVNTSNIVSIADAPTSAGAAVEYRVTTNASGSFVSSVVATFNPGGSTVVGGGGGAVIALTSSGLRVIGETVAASDNNGNGTVNQFRLAYETSPGTWTQEVAFSDDLAHFLGSSSMTLRSDNTVMAIFQRDDAATQTVNNDYFATGVPTGLTSVTPSPPSISAAFNPTSVTLGGSATLTFTITNPNASTALNGVAFSTTLPAGLVVATPNGVANSTGGTVTAVAGSGSVSLTGGTIAANGTGTVSVNVTSVTAGTESDTTTAVSSTNGGTGNTATASLTVNPAPVPDLTVSANHSPATFVRGQTGQFTFVVTNSGNGATSGNISFSCPMPPGFTATEIITGPSWNFTSSTQSLITGTFSSSMAAGANGGTITVIGTVAANAAASLSITATVGGGGETNTLNDTATDTIPVGKATPSINTTQQPASAAVGTSIADKATVTGGASPTGTVTFQLYNNATATGTPLFTDTETLVGGVATSAGYTTTASGTDYWVATYNGDANNNAVTSGAASAPVTVTAVTPAINTTQQPASAAIGSSIADKATVSGGFNPTGTVTFVLYNNPNGTGTPLFTDTESLSGGMATSKAYTAGATGTNYWVATYNGDANNNPVTAGTASEPVTVTGVTPAINTTQQPASAAVGSSIADRATVSGGFNPTGTVTFALYNNPTGTGTPLFTDTESLSGGIATSKGYTAAATGTNYWVATYNGDANNNPVTAGTALEPVIVTPASPAINTTQQPASATVGNSIADKATVSGGFNPTGTVTFRLYSNPNGTGTPLFTDTESLSGGMATSASYTATAAGTNYWVATYNGDANNNSVTAGTASEPVTVTAATAAINTTPQPASATVGSSIAAKATVSGGFNPTGTVTFLLYNNPNAAGTPLFTDTENLSGGMATSKGYTTTAAGTSYWVATYNGDQNNSPVSSATNSAPVTVTLPIVSITGHTYLVPVFTTAASLTTTTTGTGINGVTITLTGTDFFGNPVNLFTTTNGSGSYSFNNITTSNAAGYTITETPPPAYGHLGQTSTTAGSTTNTPPGTPAVISKIVLTTNGAASTDNFFEVQVPTSIALTGGNNQSATVNTAFANPLVVTVTDAVNNPIPGLSVTFTAPPSGASGIFSTSSNTTTVITNSSGQVSVPITANTAAGAYNVAVAAGTVTNHFSLTNLADVATHFGVSVPKTATAGTAFNFTVVAEDQYNNTASSYTGTVHFTSSDLMAILPTDAMLNSGTATFSATLKTAGSQTITATDTKTFTITGTSNLINVGAAAATHFSVSAPSTATQGVPFSITVTAQDQYNNVANGYLGTVHFTSSDTSAGVVLPADYPFVAGDAGVHTFTNSVTLVTSGNQTITVTDTLTSSIKGSSANINVFTVNPTPAQPGTTATLNPQTGLFELVVNVANTTGGTINGFRLHVDYSSYVKAYPSLKLFNATSLANYPDVYVDYPYPVAQGATVVMNLEFYTSTRTFPNPFKPVLSVTTLSAAETAQANPPTQSVPVARIVKLPSGNVLLEFPSVIGTWYRISYSDDSMKTWFDSAVPIQASATQTQWIDNGAPLTSAPPSTVASRFYYVKQIPAP